MTREELRNAYSVMSLQDRKDLAEETKYSMSLQYQYFLRPTSDSIGKTRMEKLLKFRPLSYWNSLAKLGANKRPKPIELKLNFIGILQFPDIVIINGKKYLPE